MALKEYKPGSTFPGRMGRTIGESEAAWPAPMRAREDAPNVLYIVIDDASFGQFGCYDPPFEFTGTIYKVTADVSGQMIQDTEEEMKAFAKVAMARQ